MLTEVFLLLACRKARRGKGRSPGVAWFALDLEKELLEFQRELRDGTYWPGAYRLFQIYERKPRTIAAAPFRDRVVHHAVMNRIEPPLDRTFIHDSYACRRGKGVHAAVDRYQVWSRRNAYALKMDVAKYFPSIDHEILKEKLRRRIKDARVLALLDRIIDTSPPVNEPPVYFPVDDLLTPPGASQRDPHRQPDQPVPCQSLPRRPGPLREGGSQGGRLPALRR